MRLTEIIDLDAWLQKKKKKRRQSISAERLELMGMIYGDVQHDLEEIELERATLELEQVKAETRKANADAAESLSKAKDTIAGYNRET
jgi:hypothetical protein